MAKPTKDALSTAYDAGRAAITEPPERRGPHACPFSPIDHPEERLEWLQGLSDAIDEQPSIDDLKAELKKAKEA